VRLHLEVIIQVAVVEALEMLVVAHSEQVALEVQALLLLLMLAVKKEVAEP
jgi:hypothetical protein